MVSTCLSQLELTFRSRNTSFQCWEKERIKKGELGEQVVLGAWGQPWACTLLRGSGLWAQGTGLNRGTTE